MTLVNRVSAFFLTAMAAVLVTCSVLFYVVVRQQLVEQFDRQLFSVLDPLVAAIEAEPDSVKWQPTEHEISMGMEGNANQARWVVTDDAGGMVEHSRNLRLDSPAGRSFLALTTKPATFSGGPHDFGEWRFVQRRIATLPPSATSGQVEEDDASVPREADEYDALVVTVGRTPAQLNAHLSRLSSLCVLLPVSVWTVSAALGRWFCTHALSPVRTMARQARSMTAADFDQLLPVGSAPDELAELGAAFNTLLRRLQAAYQQQQRFTGDAAHQLRTPLTVLLGQIDVALRRDRPGEEYRQTLQLLRGQTSELQIVVESLLYLARTDGEAEPPDRQSLALEGWLPLFLEKWDAHPRRGDLHLSVQAPQVVRASPALLGQLLENLVSNALKYSEQGTRVSVTLDGRDGWAIIAVADQGHGVDAADQAAVFQPFFRSADARRHGVAGTGLGLAIAARIATALDGAITCSSRPGEGSVFTLKLPQWRPST